MTAREALQEGAARFGLVVTDAQAEQFNTYSNFLMEYNKKINLTRITDPIEIAEKHFVDSIAPLSMAALPIGAAVVDVGTGAGFPGLPMKLVRPDLRVTLLDSLQKRLVFLEECMRRVGTDCALRHARAEIGGTDPALRGQFDAAVSRAVARLAVLCEYCLPYVKVGGVFLALKGPNLSEELEQAARAIRLLGGGAPAVTEYTLPSGDGRTLVVIPKERPTPKQYPRLQVKLTDHPL